MKRIFFMAVLIVTACTAVQAQDSATSKRLNETLQFYYNIKDALVAGNSKEASEGATSFIKSLNGLSYKIMSEGNVNTLLTDAGAIADAKSIYKQRASFANFSTNMAEVVKALSFTSSPVYIQYCPMKQASWLSNEKEIKNPYYGNSMLGCGKVSDTIRQVIN